MQKKYKRGFNSTHKIDPKPDSISSEVRSLEKELKKMKERIDEEKRYHDTDKPYWSHSQRPIKGLSTYSSQTKHRVKKPNSASYSKRIPTKPLTAKKSLDEMYISGSSPEDLSLSTIEKTRGFPVPRRNPKNIHELSVRLREKHRMRPSSREKLKSMSFREEPSPEISQPTERTTLASISSTSTSSTSSSSMSFESSSIGCGSNEMSEAVRSAKEALGLIQTSSDYSSSLSHVSLPSKITTDQTTHPDKERSNKKVSFGPVLTTQFRPEPVIKKQLISSEGKEKRKEEEFDEFQGSLLDQLKKSVPSMKKSEMMGPEWVPGERFNRISALMNASSLQLVEMPGTVCAGTETIRSDLTGEPAINIDDQKSEKGGLVSISAQRGGVTKFGFALKKKSKKVKQSSQKPFPKDESSGTSVQTGPDGSIEPKTSTYFEKIMSRALMSSMGAQFKKGKLEME
ncbi:hypothetical protein ADUPG1_009674 [Aduncisulcus paluster]|uniref:Uncharacterized protein n=1 Tax=Aduncisulcus paluster TaxID=2918883 RepID=A0ABQ5KWD4_9EUKA|nr:hypothetical protein ADUPG1_009674 [Aduncisulcus paluster]